MLSGQCGHAADSQVDRPFVELGTNFKIRLAVRIAANLCAVFFWIGSAISKMLLQQDELMEAIRELDAGYDSDDTSWSTLDAITAAESQKSADLQTLRQLLDELLQVGVLEKSFVPVLSLFRAHAHLTSRRDNA
jgi:hypothetical protein